MRVVVTGASGNVGSRVLDHLLRDPRVTSVVGLARRPPEEDARAVEWHAIDLSQEDPVTAFAGADVVIHLAFLMQPAHREAVMAATNLDGSQRVFDAVVTTGVPALVHASSVGAYSPGPTTRVDESHPTGGVGSSAYSRHKAVLEGRLDVLEREHPGLRVVRLRPGLVMQAEAASAIARYFLGPFVPQTLLRRSLLPIVPRTHGLAVQAVHTDDAATAFVLAATGDARGAFNLAAEPVLDSEALAHALGARAVPLPRAVLRAALDVTWRLRLQPTDPGWLDLATRTPLMDTTRARDELGWTARRSSTDALLELLRGMGAGAGGPAPVLAPRATGLARWREAAAGIALRRTG